MAHEDDAICLDPETPGLLLMPKDMPVRKWRCTHGHKWESRGKTIGLQLTGEMFGLAPQETLDFCGLCMREKLVAGLGQVREDT